jgi:hypothetical protein
MAPRKDSNGGVIGHESQRQRISIALPKDINRNVKGYQSQDKNFKCRKKSIHCSMAMDALNYIYGVTIK